MDKKLINYWISNQNRFFPLGMSSFMNIFFPFIIFNLSQTFLYLILPLLYLMFPIFKHQFRLQLTSSGIPLLITENRTLLIQFHLLIFYQDRILLHLILFTAQNHSMIAQHHSITAKNHSLSLSEDLPDNRNSLTI